MLIQDLSMLIKIYNINRRARQKTPNLKIIIRIRPEINKIIKQYNNKNDQKYNNNIITKTII